MLPAVAILLCGIVLLDAMGVLVRLLLARYGAIELSAYRNLIGMVPSLAMLWLAGEFRPRRGRLALRQWRLGLVRGVFVAVAQLLFYYALLRLEFATVSALTYTMSLFVVAFSVPVLGERVGPWRWAAVAMGFAGAVWIVRPGGDAFSLAAVMPLGAAACYAMSSVLARRFDRDATNALIYLYSSFAAAVCAVAIALVTTGFSPILSWGDAAMIFVMGCLGGCGVICLLVAVRRAAPSILAPFNYFGLISAFTMGWAVFGEAPFDRLFPGVLLILAGGLTVIWRERARNRARARARAG